MEHSLSVNCVLIAKFNHSVKYSFTDNRCMLCFTLKCSDCAREGGKKGSVTVFKAIASID